MGGCILINISWLLLIVCMAFTGLSSGMTATTTQTVAGSDLFAKSKARALLIADICFQYETDNDNFPVRPADLRWPVDYIKGFEQRYNTKFVELNKDPLSHLGEQPFLLVPYLKNNSTKCGAGVDFAKSSAAGFAIISPSGDGNRLLNSDLLYEETLRSGSEYTESTATMLYISNEYFHNHRPFNGLEIIDLIKQAEIGTNVLPQEHHR